MLRTRVMPCLLLRKRALVKPVRFRDPSYVGDPINTVRIFNEMEVDEIILLDIIATPEGREPSFDLLAEIASEAFMPFCYGGGVRTVEQIEALFGLGAEKVALNTAAHEDPVLLRRAVDRFGSQSVVVAIDAKKKMLGGYEVYSRCGSKGTGKDPAAWASAAAAAGAGEILLTSIDRDGTFGGYDVDLIRRVSREVDVPVIAAGGARNVDDFKVAVRDGGASAVAAGAMVVYQGPHRAVLVNFPTRAELRHVLS